MHPTSSAGLSAGEAAIRVYLGVCSARHLAILWQNRHHPVMKHRFASLTRAGLAAVMAMLSTFAMEVRSQESGGRGQPTPDSRLPIPDSRLPSAPSGQQLMAQAAKQVASEAAISAELRYRIDAFGHELVGTGAICNMAPVRRSSCGSI